MLITHKTFLPAFGMPQHQDQYPLTVYAVLSINEAVGDCAAYRGIAPNDADDALIEMIRAGGSKIREDEARQLFPEIEDMGLRYRR